MNTATSKTEIKNGLWAPRIGDPAPAFSANTTQGPVTFPNDYSGKWVILFSHPADFTPVCTSEFMLLAKEDQEFKKYNCHLLALSVDSLYSHIAWLKTIKENIQFKNMKQVEVKFPLIEDASMEISKQYGMIQPGESQTKPVRAVFFIDPKGIIRSILFYPLNIGRNVSELKRMLIAMQVADEFVVGTPVDWEPGDDVLLPAATNSNTASVRDEGYEHGKYCGDWFFCTKPLSKDESLKAGE